MVCALYGDGTIAESAVRKWFTGVRNGNFDLENGDCSGNVAVIHDIQIETPIKNNSGYTTQDIAKIRHISHISFVKR